MTQTLSSILIRFPCRHDDELSATALAALNWHNGDLMVRTKIFREVALEIEDSQDGFICTNCVKDQILNGYAAEFERPRKCSGCGEEIKNGHTPKSIADIIRKVLPRHFSVGFDRYEGYDKTLAKIVGRTILSENSIVCDLVGGHLIDQETDDDADFYFFGQMYEWNPSPFDSEEHERWYVTGDWEHVDQSLVHGQRFFNRHAMELFSGLLHEALNARRADGTKVAIREVVAGTSLYRARIVDESVDLDKLEPGSALGAPPKHRASNNRMNPAGIPLLYVAGDVKTSVAEIRPSIGDLVIVGEHQTTKNLCFFDFTAIDHTVRHEPLSLLDPTYERRTELRSLLGYINEQIGKPVRADDSGGYIITQALAEFIRYGSDTEFDGVKFDGIIYRSVQNRGGENFVLFNGVVA
ncbi:RES domain protein [compost metagenome]